MRSSSQYQAAAHPSSSTARLRGSRQPTAIITPTFAPRQVSAQTRLRDRDQNLLVPHKHTEAFPLRHNASLEEPACPAHPGAARGVRAHRVHKRRPPAAPQAFQAMRASSAFPPGKPSAWNLEPRRPLRPTQPAGAAPRGAREKATVSDRWEGRAQPLRGREGWGEGGRRLTWRRSSPARSSCRRSALPPPRFAAGRAGSSGPAPRRRPAAG